MNEKSSIPAAYIRALDELYSGQILARHQQVAKLLEMSDTQLRHLGNQRLITFRFKGRAWRYYAREDVEAHILKMASSSLDRIAEAPPTSRQSATSSPARRAQARTADFTAELARRKRKS